MRIKTAYYIYSDIFHFCCFSFIPEVLHFPVVSFSFSLKNILWHFFLSSFFWRFFQSRCSGHLSFRFISSSIFFSFSSSFGYLAHPVKFYFIYCVFWFSDFYLLFSFCISLKKASLFPFISIVFNIPTMNLVVIAVLALI